MHLSKRDERHPYLWGGLLVALILAGSIRLIAQDVSSTVIVSPPVHTNGNAQAKIVGFTPGQIQHAYGFDQIRNQGAGQTIALVEAFHHPEIQTELMTFIQTFGLPPCSGCLQVIPTTSTTTPIWSLETAIDVEWAYAIAPQANILVVESLTDTLDSLLQAVDVAVKNGATVVSMSWGGLEFQGESALDSHFCSGRAASVSFTAAAGDFGTGVIYPAVSPCVLAVGGTTLKISDNLGTYGDEVAWNGSGGGQAGFEPEPAYQTNFPIPDNSALARGNPDVAYNADPKAGFAVYTSTGWTQVGGTSAGAPQWAALIAIAKSNAQTGLACTNVAVYDVAKNSYAQNYHDVVKGPSNGNCGKLLCKATTGYDYITGIGSPKADSLINALPHAQQGLCTAH